MAAKHMSVLGLRVVVKVGTQLHSCAFGKQRPKVADVSL